MATLTPWQRMDRSALCAAVSLGRFPITVIDKWHGMQAWHCKWYGKATFPNGETAEWTQDDLVRVVKGAIKSDICVFRFKAPVKTVKPVVIIPAVPGFMRRPSSSATNPVLVPVNPTVEATRLLHWDARQTVLFDGDSGSAGLIQMTEYVGQFTFATSYTYGPNLWWWKYAIEEAKK